jgi:hypothetical protein
MKGPKPPYIFFRESGWYPIECRNDEDARNQADINPGTVRVERHIGKVV